MLKKWKLLLSVAFSTTMLLSPVYAASPFTAAEINTITSYLFDNIATKDHRFTKASNSGIIESRPGAVLASPSLPTAGFSQDYQFHWVRDAAITMQEVAHLYRRADAEGKKRLDVYLHNYIEFERVAQNQSSRAGEQTLGQPKYNIDGTIWEGEWARPQNDGPALRALTITMIANLHLESHQDEFVQERLLEMIAKDLDYVVREWRHRTFDVWEEVSDQDHFFTKMVQRKALIEGAKLFQLVHQVDRAEVYLHTADQITDSLKGHWSDWDNYYTETIQQTKYKGGGLDTSVLIGLLLGNLEDKTDPFSLDSYQVMNTVLAYNDKFSTEYMLNYKHANLPVLLGRYPGDIYDGDQFSGGNPWVLTTNALAEYYYSLAATYKKAGEIKVTYYNMSFFNKLGLSLKEEGVCSETINSALYKSIINALISSGDALLRRLKLYGDCYENRTCNHFAEQIDRNSGQQVSAKDLTWGYTSLLTALQIRPEKLQST